MLGDMIESPDDHMVQRARFIYSRFPRHDRQLSDIFSELKHKIIDVPIIRPADNAHPRQPATVQNGLRRSGNRRLLQDCAVFKHQNQFR